MESNKLIKHAKQSEKFVLKKSSSKFSSFEINFEFDYIFIIKAISNIILLFLYIVITKYTKKNPRICLCTVGKMENLYAKEFVDHYKQLGYSHIYIYDNNDVDGEKFEDVLQDEIKSNFVSIINFRGIIGKQCRIYRDCYAKNNKNYENQRLILSKNF